MTKSKTSPALSKKFKFAIGYLYFVAFSWIISALLFAFSSDKNLLDNWTSAQANELVAVRIFSVITGFIAGGLVVATVYLLHKRRKWAISMYFIQVIFSYGIAGLAIGTTKPLTVEDILFTVLFVAIDVAIALLLLRSSEARVQLKN